MTPKNISTTFYAFCEDCDICEPVIEENITDENYSVVSYKWHCISCKHLEACERMHRRTQ